MLTSRHGAVLAAAVVPWLFLQHAAAVRHSRSPAGHHARQELRELLRELVSQGTTAGHREDIAADLVEVPWADYSALLQQLQQFASASCDPTDSSISASLRLMFSSSDVETDEIEMYLYPAGDLSKKGDNWINTGECLHATLFALPEDDDESEELHATIHWVSNKCGKGEHVVNVAMQAIQCFSHDAAHLDDQSAIPCKDSPVDKVSLPLLRVILKGQTWYGKYGFVANDTVDRDALSSGQQALSQLSLDAAQQAYTACGKASEDVRTSLGTYIAAAQPRTLAGFAAWLVREDCKNAQQILEDLLPFPCEAYPTELKGWGRLPVARGDLTIRFDPLPLAEGSGDAAQVSAPGRSL